MNIKQGERMSNHIKKSWMRNQHGGIALISAIALPVLLGTAGLAVDLNRYMKVSGYIQSSVDQAALAATSAGGQREAVARKFYNASLNSNAMQYVTPGAVSVTVTPASEDVSLAVQVTAAATVKTMFGGFVGFDSFDLTKTAKAERYNQNVEAVITMASGGTMCATKERIPNNSDVIPGETNVALRPDPSCRSFESMKAGVQGFINNLGGDESVRNLKIGLVPYNYKVKMPNLNQIPPSLLVNEEQQFFSNVVDAEPLSEVLPLTSNLTELRDFVDGMSISVNATAWSRSDLASHVAGLMLDPTQKTYFDGGLDPAPLEGAQVKKLLVIMSDGINSGCCYTNWPLGNFTNQYVVANRDYNRDQLEICKVLKENNIEIYSILFDIEETDSGGAQIHNVFARCATAAHAELGDGTGEDELVHCRDRQNCFGVSSHEDLEAAFKQISQKFYRPILVQ